MAEAVILPVIKKKAEEANILRSKSSIALATNVIIL